MVSTWKTIQLSNYRVLNQCYRSKKYKEKIELSKKKEKKSLFQKYKDNWIIPNLLDKSSNNRAKKKKNHMSIFINAEKGFNKIHTHLFFLINKYVLSICSITASSMQEWKRYWHHLNSHTSGGKEPINEQIRGQLQHLFKKYLFKNMPGFH